MKVLLATDGSNYARIAERMLSLTPRCAGADVAVATVVPPVHLPLVGMEPFGTVALGEQIREIDEIGRAHAQTIAEETAARLNRTGFRASATVLQGDVAHELLTHAEASKADLVALGSRGHGAVQTFFLGSVARRVVSHANCSVLVAHPYFQQSAEVSLATLEDKAKLRVVVGVDGGQGAGAAMEWLLCASEGTLGRICAVCAEPLSIMPAGVDPMAFGALYDYDRDRVAALAKAASEKLAGVTEDIDWFTDLGRPVEVLTDAAEREKADLLVLGATRHGAFERFMIGSVSFEVAVKAPCSVLVVRPIATPAGS